MLMEGYISSTNTQLSHRQYGVTVKFDGSKIVVRFPFDCVELVGTFDILPPSTVKAVKASPIKSLPSKKTQASAKHTAKFKASPTNSYGKGDHVKITDNDVLLGNVDLGGNGQLQQYASNTGTVVKVSTDSEHRSFGVSVQISGNSVTILFPFQFVMHDPRFTNKTTVPKKAEAPKLKLKAPKAAKNVNFALVRQDTGGDGTGYFTKVSILESFKSKNAAVSRLKVIVKENELLPADFDEDSFDFLKHAAKQANYCEYLESKKEPKQQYKYEVIEVELKSN